MWDCEVREELSDKNIISKDDNGLNEGGVIMVQGRVDNSFIENWVGEDIDQEDFSLGNGETEKVERNFVGRSVEDQGHYEMEGPCLRNTLYPLPVSVT